MKWCFVIMFGVCSLAWADDAVVPKKEIVTGSNIPRVVKYHAHAADTVAPVYVVSRQEIDRSGAGSVGQALRRLPFVTGFGH